MKNYVQKGHILGLSAPYDRLSGEAALVGLAFGVATTDVLNGTNGQFQTRGVFDLPKATGAVTQGQQMYWDDTAKNVTTTSSGNTSVGYATQAQSSGDSTARVSLIPGF